MVDKMGAGGGMLTETRPDSALSFPCAALLPRASPHEPNFRRERFMCEFAVYGQCTWTPNIKNETDICRKREAFKATETTTKDVCKIRVHVHHVECDYTRFGHMLASSAKKCFFCSCSHLSQALHARKAQRSSFPSILLSPGLPGDPE